MRRICRLPPTSVQTLFLACGLLPGVLPAVGCKSLNEAYLRMEVWKYEQCFGHLPPGFVPTGVAPPMAAPAMQPCGQQAPCGPAAPGAAPCASAAGVGTASAGCAGCSGAVVERGSPVITVPTPAGSSSPTPAAVTTSKPVVISDEIVLP